MSVPLDELTFMLNERIAKCKDFMLSVFEIENAFIDTVYRSQKDFIDKYALGNLGGKNEKILKELY